MTEEETIAENPEAFGTVMAGRIVHLRETTTESCVAGIVTGKEGGGLVDLCIFPRGERPAQRESIGYKKRGAGWRWPAECPNA